MEQGRIVKVWWREAFLKEFGWKAEPFGHGHTVLEAVVIPPVARVKGLHGLLLIEFLGEGAIDVNG